MKTIRDLLARDLTQKIEEVIQVSQTDEQSVYSEITEYVATDRIKDQYHEILKAMAEAPAVPHGDVGVWISGFFGSGKSSFAKNLGYVLTNPEILGHPASELFKRQIKDHRIGELLDFINVKIPTEVIMFDVSKGAEIRRAEEKIAEIVYRALLMKLDYSTDYDIAELEIELEGQGKLEEFIALCPQVNKGLDWKKARKGAMKINYASAILNRMDPGIFPQADSWAKSLRERHNTITVETVVDRVFQLAARRSPNKGMVFIIDEVGQYVARSAEKIEDLRALVEQFGKISKNYVKAKKAVAPVWVVVTSQEKLDEVVAAIDSKRVDLAKLQDRFKFRVDLAPADIREVATKRVLAKTDEAEPLLRKLFKESQGQLNVACRLEKTPRKSEITEEDFVQFYPYLPHYIEMSILIMSGIRLQPGAPRHYGGSNRTIIKQAYEMLVSDRTALASKEIGTLVTLDKIFELVEGNLSSEKQKDISDIAHIFQNEPEDRGMTVRAAKVISLLEFVQDIPRTEQNIAACLVDEVGRPAPLAEVQGAVKRLEKAQFIRNTEDGWKLQTAQEKNWDTERRAIEPRPKDRHEITRSTLQDIFNEPQLKNYRFRNLRTFQVGISVDGVRVGAEGDVNLSIFTAEDADSLGQRTEDARSESREASHKYDIYWVFALNPDIDDLQASLFASRQMIAKYDQLRAQNRINKEYANSLENERHEANRIQNRLREKMVESLETGQGLFHGISYDASDLGKTAGEIFKKLFDRIFPDLYPKLEMGFRPLKRTEVEEVLKAANLNALSQVFYDGDQGLNLVTKEGARYVPNPTAEVAREVLDYIRREHSYGNKVTGRTIEEHFRGLIYGWESDMVRLVLAVLLRAGSIEVTHQGRRFRNYQEPQSHVPLVNIPAFRAASFAPRESIGLKTLATAVQNLEELTGEEVDIEEGAIATAFKKLADEELKLLLPVVATAQANDLPLSSLLDEYRQTLNDIQSAASDDCVRILAGEGKSFKDSRDRVRHIREAISGNGLLVVRQARNAVSTMWPVLSLRGRDGELQEKAEELQTLVASEAFFERLNEIDDLSRAISETYASLYTELHQQRASDFIKTIDEVKGRAEWALLAENMQESVFFPLSSRACETLELPKGSVECGRCRASISEMESDIAALGGLKKQVLVRLQELTAPVEPDGAHIERIRISEFFTDVIDSEAAFNAAVERLREHLLKLIAEGAKVIIE
ncbi:MAG: BREX system P-loop protein BrxC [Pyrinomonadaceae bacterium]|nr:BREX system P-loop protein BrxC [Pyrinomonadaceae bacterium]